MYNVRIGIKRHTKPEQYNVVEIAAASVLTVILTIVDNAKDLTAHSVSFRHKEGRDKSGIKVADFCFNITVN